MHGKKQLLPCGLMVLLLLGILLFICRPEIKFKKIEEDIELENSLLIREKNALNYGIVIRNLTADCLRIKSFPLTDTNNSKLIKRIKKVISPYSSEIILAEVEACPKLEFQTFSYFYHPDEYDVEKGKSAKEFSQEINENLPQLVNDQPWILKNIVFNFTGDRIIVSYVLNIRNQNLEFLPSGQLWNAQKDLENRCCSIDEEHKITMVENPFMLRSADDNFGIFLVNCCDQKVTVVEFPSWIPDWQRYARIESAEERLQSSWTDTPMEINLYPSDRVSLWKFDFPEVHSFFRFVWEIRNKRNKVIKRVSSDYVELKNIDELLQHNELYSINFVYKDYRFITTYTKIVGNTLIDVQI